MSMETQQLKINEQSLELAAKLINSGEIVAFPTETVYGLGASALDVEAVKKIFIAKGRPNDNPLIVHVSDVKMIDMVAKDISQDAKKVLQHFFPGSLTVVLNKKDVVPDTVTAGLDTVGVRMPLSQEARDFIARCKVPIAAPSANTSSRPSPTRSIDVYNDMKGLIPLVLCGQDCQVGIESTVLDMTREIATILRPGIVTPTEIAKVIGKQVAYVNPNETKINSPGVKYKHYAPNIPMILDTTYNIGKVANFYNSLIVNNCKAVIMCQTQFVASFPLMNTIDLGCDDAQVARNIYSALHDAEKIYDYIICMYGGNSEVANSVLNRLTKAAGGKLL